MPFDYAGAKAAGYNDDEIIQHLASEKSFDLAGAKKSGYTDQEILGHLTESDTTAPPQPEGPVVPAESQPTPPKPSPIEELPGKIAKFTVGAIKETGHQIRALSELASASYDPHGFINYITTNGYDQNLATVGDSVVARQHTIRDNLTTTALATFNVAGAALSGGTNVALQELGAKLGLQGALKAITAGAVEGGSFFSLYNGIGSAIEGESAKQTAEKMAQGFGAGSILGGLGAGGVEGFNALRTGARQEAKGGILRQQILKDSASEMQRTARMMQRAEVEKQVVAKAQQEATNLKQVEQTIQESIQTLPITKADFNGFDAMNVLRDQLGSKLPKLSKEDLDQAVSTAVTKYRRAFQDAASDKLSAQIKNLNLPSDQPTPAFGIIGSPVEQELSTRFDALSAPPQPPEPPIIQRARSIPYYGTEKLKPYIRAQSNEPLTIRERINQAWNHYAGGAYTAEPGATPPVKDAFLAARYSILSAPERADQTIFDRVVSVLQGSKDEVGKKSAWLSDYMAALARVARMKSLEQPGPGMTPLVDWEREAQMLAKPVVGNPDVLQAHNAARGLLDEMFETMVEHGIIERERYRPDYIPFVRLQELAGKLAETSSNTTIGRKLSATLRAQTSMQITKTNVIQLMRDSQEALYRKVAENKLVQTLANDPEVNFTHLFMDNQPLPKGYSRWMVQPGMAGWQGTDALSEGFYGAAKGAADELGIQDKHVPGNYVFTTDAVNRLRGFYRHTISPTERTIYKAVNAFSRFLTLYSSTNRVLNQLSDTPMAIMGLPGEKSDLFGFIRFYPKAFVAAYKGAFGKSSPLYKRATTEGLAGATYIRSIGGDFAHSNLEAALAQGEKSFVNPLSKIGELVTRERQAGEAIPRIAAGLAAEARSGNAADFARVGRASTLPYGAGDPLLAREPMGRLLAPFWRWTGLATERMFRLATTEGSRGRTWAALTIPAVAAATWNIQNEEFKKAEYSLPEYLRNTFHIILMNPKTQAVLRDRNGQPRVWQMRFNVPESVLSFYGLGNLPGRLIDIGSGYTTPGEFLTETSSDLGQNIAGLPAALVTANQVLTGRSSLTGQQMEPLDRIETILPSVNLTAKVLERGQNQGIQAGAAEIPERMVGIKSAGVKGGQGDAKTQQIAMQIHEAETQLRSAAAKGNTVKVEYFRKKILALANRQTHLQQVIAQ